MDGSRSPLWQGFIHPFDFISASLHDWEKKNMAKVYLNKVQSIRRAVLCRFIV